MARGSTTDTIATQSPLMVIGASSLGTIFEWYDFFLYGILSALIGRQFFPPDNPTAALLATLATFGAGFGVRPLGAVVFGHFGDTHGRKYAFLITLLLMGGATAAVGLVPTYASIGIAAPATLLALRLLQGFALGGEYGGAAIYVAEYAPAGKRGAYTSWIQVSAALGFLLCLIVVLSCRGAMTSEAFERWGWRVPFLLSIVMLALSIFIRLRLAESPLFRKMRDEGASSKAPLRESFSSWRNIRQMIVALLGVTAGLTVIYYTSQFGALYFLQGTARVPEHIALVYMAAGVIIAAPFYVICGHLSDRFGRKRLLLIGYALSMSLTFPLFHLLAHGANPALMRATRDQPVTLSTPPCDFSVFAQSQSSPCGKALAFLARQGITYSTVTGDRVALEIGDHRVVGFDAEAYREALAKAGYPSVVSPGDRNPWMIVGAVVGLIILSALSYGQIAAILVEMFPTRIRYTALSIPYHLGSGYFGGFLPFIAQYIVVRSGNVFGGLWYTVGTVALAFFVTLIWLPESAGNEL